jgi:HAD superfamily hydrolase (TIGR01509 family)
MRAFGEHLHVRRCNANMSTLEAIIFDFDGVIADTEPLHYGALQQVLAELGISLSERQYYADYLGYDDRGCFMAALSANGQMISPGLIDDLMKKKARAYLHGLPARLKIFPGVRELVREAARHYELGIASGALRHEIELILEQANLRKQFSHITSAEDVTQGKPSPDPFLRALSGLNTVDSTRRLLPAGCLVIEDSLPGIRGAHAAGMKVLAVANTHDIDDLHEADAIVSSLDQLQLPELVSRLWK